MWTQRGLSCGLSWTVLSQLTKALGHLTCAFFWRVEVWGGGNELDKDGLSFKEYKATCLL